MNASVRQSFGIFRCTAGIFFYVIRMNPDNIISSFFWITDTYAVRLVHNVGNKFVPQKSKNTLSYIRNNGIFCHIKTLQSLIFIKLVRNRNIRKLNQIIVKYQTFMLFYVFARYVICLGEKFRRHIYGVIKIQNRNRHVFGFIV